MADDKGGGGGGSSWGTLEIIVGIILLIGLLDRISGGISGSLGQGSKTTVTTEQTSEKMCGLTIYAPVEGQKVSRDVSVEGIAGTCNWKVANGIALFAQVIDAKGAPLSDYTPIRSQDKDPRGKIQFSEMVPIVEIPKTKTGYLILVPAEQSRTRYTISVRIPISFQ